MRSHPPEQYDWVAAAACSCSADAQAKSPTPWLRSLAIEGRGGTYFTPSSDMLTPKTNLEIRTGCKNKQPRSDAGDAMLKLRPQLARRSIPPAPQSFGRPGIGASFRGSKDAHTYGRWRVVDCWVRFGLGGG